MDLLKIILYQSNGILGHIPGSKDVTCEPPSEPRSELELAQACWDKCSRGC